MSSSSFLSQTRAIPLMVSTALFFEIGDHSVVMSGEFTTVAVPPILWRGSAGAHYGIYNALGKNNY
jgi:hypothetical protein